MIYLSVLLQANAFTTADASFSSYATPTYQYLNQTCPVENSNCVVDKLNKLTDDLFVNEVIEVEPSFWKKTRGQQSLPNYVQRKEEPIYVSVKDIHFMQASASGIFTDLKHDLIEVARLIQRGKLSPDDLPTVKVWRDINGKIWTLNHRRLIAMLMSKKVDKIKVKWIDRKTVISNKEQFTTKNGGSGIYVWITDHAGLYVTH